MILSITANVTSGENKTKNQTEQPISCKQLMYNWVNRTRKKASGKSYECSTGSECVKVEVRRGVCEGGGAKGAWGDYRVCMPAQTHMQI